MSNKSSSKQRKKFTEAEDQRLYEIISKMGPRNWRVIAEQMPGRTGRQCRDRYTNYLMENLRNEPWTQEEDALLISKFLEYGSHWSEMVQFFNGRSSNSIKNRWYTNLAHKVNLNQMNERLNQCTSKLIKHAKSAPPSQVNEMQIDFQSPQSLYNIGTPDFIKIGQNELVIDEKNGGRVGHSAPGYNDNIEHRIRCNKVNRKVIQVQDNIPKLVTCEPSSKNLVRYSNMDFLLLHDQQIVQNLGNGNVVTA